MSDERAIRVFVSSTFRDMVEERDYLVKFTFPQLRRLCESRGVIWGEVDLRWGVTNEATAERKVLPYCLEEIRRTRPFFIGILGQRYGWVPEAIPEDLVVREPWLSKLHSRSVTELEILHGVLNDPLMADHAFFYFRDPSFVDRLPPAADRSQFRSEDADSARKLEDLKGRIRASGLSIRENFRDASALGELVLSDFRGLIDQLFPEGSTPEALDLEAREHEAFARSRQRIFIGKQDILEELDAHVRRDGPPLVVVGESGIGKSALLANWIQRKGADAQTSSLLVHFVGATSSGTDWASTVRRLLGELNRRLHLELAIPDTSGLLRSAFSDALATAASRARTVIVLDAINQMEDREGALDLVWLPREIPPNVRLIMSTAPGRVLDEARRRGWLEIEIPGLRIEDRRAFVVRYLKEMYAKELSDRNVELIAASMQAANPLYLRVLLEELRLFGDHDRLDDIIVHYLDAESVPSLYSKILERYERDYETKRPGLIRDALTYLWASRSGLTEIELLELLGTSGERLAQAIWTPVLLAAESSLISRAGVLVFFHDYFKEAVESRYLQSIADRHWAHVVLSAYFSKLEPNIRRVKAEPWHLCQAEAWAELAEWLGGGLFSSTYFHDQYALTGYWARVEEIYPGRMLNAYGPCIRNPKAQSARLLVVVAELLDQFGYRDEALQIKSYLIERFQQLSAGGKAVSSEARPKDEPTRATATEKMQHSGAVAPERLPRLSLLVGNKAVTLRRVGQLDEALRLYKEQEALCRERGDLRELAMCLGNQSSVYTDRGLKNEALDLLREQERVCRDIGERAVLGKSLGNQSIILREQGDLQAALKLNQEQERIAREFDDLYELSGCLGNRALIARSLGDKDGAMKLLSEQETMCRSIGNKEFLIRCLGNQGEHLLEDGELDRAWERFVQCEHLCRETCDLSGLAMSLESQSSILMKRGESRQLLDRVREIGDIYRRMGLDDRMTLALGAEADLLCELGDIDAAISVFRQQEEEAKKLGNMDGLAYERGVEGDKRHQRGDLDGALRLHREEERIARETGDTKHLATCLQAQLALLSHPTRIFERTDFEKIWAITEELAHLAPDQFAARFELLRPLAELALSKVAREDAERPPKAELKQGLASTAHPRADPEGAAQRSVNYRKALKAWKALPFFKRMRTPKPPKPPGVFG